MNFWKIRKKKKRKKEKMTSDQFNKKWCKYLEKGCEGIEIEDLKVIQYLDKEFTREVKTNPNFKYSQIKMKFGTSRVYTNSDKSLIWEDEINELMK